MFSTSKVQKSYKLFRVKKNHKGKLFPLFVDSTTPLVLNTWYSAKCGNRDSNGKVKSKLGPLAYRPGWHSGDLPIATHIGEGGSPPKYRPCNQVWAEILVSAEVDWQPVANSRGINNKNKLVAKNAHITDQIPKNGFYRYKTNPNMLGNWLISGEMKIIKVLSDEEVCSINNPHGLKDLPRKELFDLEYYGF